MPPPLFGEESAGVIWWSMLLRNYPYASQLRLELGLRNRSFARGRSHAESYGRSPVIVYAPEEGRHGNFFDPAYTAISARPEWMRRFDKVHTQAGHSLPKLVPESTRRWRELDSSMSSDALLMNVFCTPGVADSKTVQQLMGIEQGQVPEFGWKARVPLKAGRFDRTEVDMRWGDLLAESKLTEADFQTREAAVVEGYRDLDEVFERDLLPRAAIAQGRRREAAEFPEDYSQDEKIVPPDEWEPVLFQDTRATTEAYASYQLIRNVLAAYAQESSFCVIHDARRPDLRESWFEVMAAVRPAAMRSRLKVLTWQELAEALPAELQEFLDLKYGIVAPGRTPSRIDE